MVEIVRNRKGRDLRRTATHRAAVHHGPKWALFNGSQIREGAISGLIVMVLLIGVVSNMPASAIKQVLVPTLTPIAVGTGLDQFWGMYAPEPPSRLEDLEVHVTMADGADRVWMVPQSDRVVGVAVSHRWRKLKESLLSEPQIRPQMAHWVVKDLTVPAERADRVYMILRTKMLLPPGVTGPAPTGVEMIYDEDLTRNS